MAGAGGRGGSRFDFDIFTYCWKMGPIHLQPKTYLTERNKSWLFCIEKKKELHVNKWFVESVYILPEEIFTLIVRMTKVRSRHQSKMPSDDILTTCISKAYTVSPYRNLPEIQNRLQRRSCLSIVANHVLNVRSSPSFGGIGGSYAESVTVVWSDVVSLSQPDLSVSPNSILVTKTFFYMCSINNLM